MLGRRVFTFRRTLSVFVLAVALADPGLEQQARPLTPDLALDVRSASIADVTDDGRWIALTVQTRRDRTDVDHKRFGDPTYVSPASTRVLLVETSSREQRWLYADPVQVRGLTWSPAGNWLSQNHGRITVRQVRSAIVPTDRRPPPSFGGGRLTELTTQGVIESRPRPLSFPSDVGRG